ncbi:hypothetical protein [Parachlamydia sp.]|uniref:hypothetical protein n=1 Tax=Parachlamydia sp. TaxID=2052048 RepID=UPI003D0FC047
MKDLLKHRHQLIGLAVALYLIPLFVLTFMSLQHLPLSKSWTFLSVGLFLSLAGSLFLLFVLKGWEDALKLYFENIYIESQKALIPETPAEDFAILKQKVEELTEQEELLARELSQKDTELAEYQNREEEIKRLVQISEDFAEFRLEMEQQIEEREQLIHTLRQETHEQKNVLQSKDDRIEDLESQVNDRNYELQTLLKFSEHPQFKSEVFSPKDFKSIEPVKNSPAIYSIQEELERGALAFHDDTKISHAEGASHQLKQCIEIVQNITGVNHFSSQSSLFRDLPVNSNALDLRRLGDSLGSENMAALAVYSKKEHKLLYANHQIRHLLGWSSDKFLQDFPEIVQDGLAEWKTQIQGLSSSHEAKIRLVMKTKFGENLLLNCHLGLIPSGIFCNHVIAVFYP